MSYITNLFEEKTKINADFLLLEILYLLELEKEDGLGTSRCSAILVFNEKQDIIGVMEVNDGEIIIRREKCLLT